jgi:hypothetical protein
MDLTNKIVTISFMSVNGYPAETNTKVAVTEEVAQGVFKTLDTYDIKFEQIYQGPEDPALLAAINEKLLALP